MRLATIQINNESRCAILHSDALLPLMPSLALSDIIRAPSDLDAFSRFVDSSIPPIPTTEAVYLPPLPRPSKIICVGLNYADHTSEVHLKQPEYPTIFLRVPTTLVGHNGLIINPRSSTQLDYEGELAVIVGRNCTRVSEADAPSHIFGYSIFNDASVRDYQFKTSQWAWGKNFDSTGGFGPYVVTADELPIGASGLAIRTVLNGTVVQTDNTSNMIHNVSSLLHLISSAITLNPGDVIVSGTPSGVGWSRTPQLFMADGDTCEVTIEGIGTLTNQIHRADSPD